MINRSATELGCQSPMNTHPADSSTTFSLRSNLHEVYNSLPRNSQTAADRPRPTASLHNLAKMIIQFKKKKKNCDCDGAEYPTSHQFTQKVNDIVALRSCDVADWKVVFTIAHAGVPKLSIRSELRINRDLWKDLWFLELFRYFTGHKGHVGLFHNH